MFEQIKKVIAEQLNVAESKITPSANIKTDLGADSLDLVELLMFLENEHGITIADDVANNFKTVEDIVNYLEKHTK